jgi:hypothetical protein
MSDVSSTPIEKQAVLLRTRALAAYSVALSASAPDDVSARAVTESTVTIE